MCNAIASNFLETFPTLRRPEIENSKIIENICSRVKIKTHLCQLLNSFSRASTNETIILKKEMFLILRGHEACWSRLLKIMPADYIK